MKNHIFKTMFAFTVSMGLAQQACNASSVGLGSLLFAGGLSSGLSWGLNSVLATTATVGLTSGVGAVYKANDYAHHLAHRNKTDGVQSKKPAVVKHALRAGIIGSVGALMGVAEHSLRRGMSYGLPVHKLAFIGRCGISIGLGLALLKGTDVLAKWTAKKLKKSAYKEYVKNMVKVTGYLAGLYTAGVALGDSYDFTR